MDKQTLDRLRALAGNEVPVEAPADESRKNMYQIMESLEKVEETDEEVTEETVEETDEEVTEETVEETELDEAEQMREWANSVYKQYDDKGHYQEQPDGETVDLSLRRYLDAEAHPVKLEEDHTEEGLLREYKEFKEDK